MISLDDCADALDLLTYCQIDNGTFGINYILFVGVHGFRYVYIAKCIKFIHNPTLENKYMLIWSKTPSLDYKDIFTIALKQVILGFHINAATLYTEIHKEYRDKDDKRNNRQLEA